MANTDTRSPHLPDLKKISFGEGFWSEKIRVNRETTLAVEYEQLASTNRLEILKGDWNEDSGYTPHIFWDSDVAKWLEAAAYSLQSHADAALEAQCDEVIDDLAKLQEDDGYLNSYFSQVEPEERWTHLRDRHELYCAGHLMEGAVAYYEATGKRQFLDVMSRYADHIATVFGPENGKKKGYPGHEEIELALAKLYRATGEKRYLDLAKYFVDQRGARPHYFDEEAVARGEAPQRRWGGYDYNQAHTPVREQTTAVGHSVRACYLYAGMADVAREAGDAGLTDACKTLWSNIVEKRMYVHGGIGSCHVGERFSYDYDLPNEEAYAETCAAIALVFFAQRMFLLEQNSAYIDVLERALYNGVISGVSADGRRFFYDNYLESHPGYHPFRNRKEPDRQEWFGCACCPPNLARLVASLGSYLFASSDDEVWLNLYADYRGSLSVAGGELEVAMKTSYPWDGKVSVKLRTGDTRRFGVRLRVPGWCESWSLSVNAQSLSPDVKDGYAVIDREWSDGDEIEMILEMPVTHLSAHPSVRHDAGKIALQRGPLVYCVEEIDNGKDLANLHISADADIKAVYDEALLGGVVTITGVGSKRNIDDWEGALYRPATLDSYKERTFKAIPYFAWNNRGVGEMRIWLHTERR
jgi:uncharacterized protein